MTVVSIRTKAEQALLAHFEAFAATAPAKRHAELRRRALGTYAAQGLPSRRSETWRYSDLRAHMQQAFPPRIPQAATVSAETVRSALGRGLAALEATTLVVYNGAMMGVLGGAALPEGVQCKALSDVNQAPSDRWLDDAAVALNLAFFNDGAVLDVAAGAEITQPLHIVHVTDLSAPEMIVTRNLVRVGAGARVKLIESHVGIGGTASQSNVATELTVGDGARVRHVKVTTDEPGTHLASWLIGLGANATYDAFQYTQSAAFVRNQANIIFRGEGTTVSVNAVFLARDHEHVDTTLVIDHAVPHCTSRELVKGVLDGHARGVFQGKVMVRPHAQKTDGKMMAKALMLSELAEFNSKPELEIYADDVVCGHGSTTAEINDEPMFYLRSRGIPEQQARAMLIEAFVGEVFDLIESEPLRAALHGMATGWLAHK